MADIVEIYTDGACKGNPGPGGWGVLLCYNGVEKELCGGENPTTNNRMELLAVIRGIQALKRESSVRIVTDSQYVKKGITEWIGKWRRNGWKTATGSPVKNLDLWQTLDEVVAKHRVHWTWVKGHSGHPGNERADDLANRGIGGEC